MKKIMMVVESLGGGVFTYVSQLANDMCEDFQVYIVYAIRKQTPDNYRDFFSPKVNLIEISNFGEFKNIINLIRTIKELRKIEMNIKPDIIHLHSSIAGGIGRLAFKGKNNVVLYTPHGYNYLMVGERTIKGKVYKMLEKILGRKDCITVTCCKSEDDEAKKLTRKTSYIETGINIDDLSESLDNLKPVRNEKFTVFTLGRICFQKQPKLFNEIAKLVPEARFVWIGDGELRDELTSTNIEITGWKPRKEALSISKGADVFILCSLGEAIAMSLLEEMYMKKLCLVSNVVGNKSVIEDEVNGYVCETAQEYAKRIKQCMRKFPRELPEKAYNDILNKYNTNKMKLKYIDFYNEISDKN